MAIVSDELYEKAYDIWGQLPRVSVSKEIRHQLLNYARSLLYREPWFGAVLFVAQKFGEPIDLTHKNSFFAARIAESDLKLMLKKLEFFSEKVEIQRRNSFLLIERMKELPIKLPLEKERTYCNYYLFPLLLKNKEQRDRLSKYLRNRGIDSTRLYEQVPIKARDYGYRGDCPNTEELTKRILTIPNHYWLSRKKINKIVEAVNSFFRCSKLMT